MNLLIHKIIVYVLEGLGVTLALYFTAKKHLEFKEIAMVSLSVITTIIVLDTFSPNIATGTRQGMGLGIGINQVIGMGGGMSGGMGGGMSGGMGGGNAENFENSMNMNMNTNTNTNMTSGIQNEGNGEMPVEYKILAGTPNGILQNQIQIQNNQNQSEIKPYEGKTDGTLILNV